MNITEKILDLNDNIPPMYEYLLWSNCSNNCQFCWQKYKADLGKLLSVSEQIKSIDQLMNILPTLPYSDMLIVGGECMEYAGNDIYMKLAKLYGVIINRLKENKTRYLYINTNLIYKLLDNVTLLIQCLESCNLLDKLKFTTSYDVYGRFATEEKRKLFLKNLDTLTYSFPKLKIVVNCILTKQLCENRFDVKAFCDKYRTQINLIPYIVLTEDMRPTKEQIADQLSRTEAQIPGYIKSYIENFDLKQEKLLYEYDKNDGYVFCSSEDDSCGHNKNFKKVLDTGECFICWLKEQFN
jgi:hypothetical protein